MRCSAETFEPTTGIFRKGFNSFACPEEALAANEVSAPPWKAQKKGRDETASLNLKTVFKDTEKRA